jgi:hypothetical protein
VAAASLSTDQLWPPPETEIAARDGVSVAKLTIAARGMVSLGLGSTPGLLVNSMELRSPRCGRPFAAGAPAAIFGAFLSRMAAGDSTNIGVARAGKQCGWGREAGRRGMGG